MCETVRTPARQTGLGQLSSGFEAMCGQLLLVKISHPPQALHDDLVIVLVRAWLLLPTGETPIRQPVLWLPRRNLRSTLESLQDDPAIQVSGYFESIRCIMVGARSTIEMLSSW